MNVGAVTTAVNATITAVMQEQRRKVLAHFTAHGATSPGSAIARAGLAPAMHSTLDQLRAQGIIKDTGGELSYLDAAALALHEKDTARSARVALAVIVPVMVAVAVAVVVAITFSR